MKVNILIGLPVQKIDWIKKWCLESLIDGEGVNKKLYMYEWQTMV